MDRTCVTKLDGLDDSVIPIQPITVSRAGLFLDEDNVIRKRFYKRKQIPVTPAYSFTDYKAQGQTMESVLIDIAKPPGKPLSNFNYYVAISRSRGRESIRLLRPFNAKDLERGIPHSLMDEDDRLERLNNYTKTWYRDNVSR